MPDPESLTLDSISLLLVWTAIAVYLLAFVAYAIDLAQRSVRRDEPQRVPALVTAGGDTQNTGDERAALNEVRTRPGQRQRLLWARIGTVLTGFAFVFHLAGTIGRGLDAGRVPWANMYEFALTGTLLIVAVYLAVLRVGSTRRWHFPRVVGMHLAFLPSAVDTVDRVRVFDLE